MGKFSKFGSWGKNVGETLAVYGQHAIEEENPLEPYYDKKRTALGEQKAADLKQLDENRIKQRQEAAINNELLMKYLPQINKASGLTGLGVAQSANVDALSRYAQNIGNIESNFQQGVSDLERAYRSDSAAIDAEERTEMLAEEERLRTDAKEKYGEALEVVLSGHFTDTNDLSKYLTGMGFDEGTKERSALEAYAIPYLKYEEEVGGTTPVGTVSDTGDTVYVPFEVAEGNAPGGFNLAISAPIENKDAFLDVVGDKDEGEVFVHDGGIYIFKNGTVYALTDKNGSITSRTYSDAYNYLANGTAPETRPMDQMPNVGKAPESDITLSRISNGVVYYKGDDGTEKSFEKILQVPRYMQNDEVRKYRNNNNKIFNIDNTYYMWQDDNLYALIV